MDPYLTKEVLPAGQAGSTIPEAILREIEIYEAEVNRFKRGVLAVRGSAVCVREIRRRPHEEDQGENRQGTRDRQ